MSRPVNLANLLTILRLFLAPLFVVAYSLIDLRPIEGAVQSLVAMMWVLYVMMETTDILDGMVARRQGIVSDLGKVLDPFADVVCRLTYFVVLSVAGIMPLWFVMIVLYRELAAVFLRLLFVRSGHALGAGSVGKLKSWFYSLSAAAGLFLFSSDRLPGVPASVSGALPTIRTGALIVYGVAAVLALWSIGGYVAFYVRRRHSPSGAPPPDKREPRG